MHYIYLFVVFCLTLALIATQVSTEQASLTAPWAVWLSAAAAAASSVSALTAAVLLRKTLLESETVTKIMNKQLRQDRAQIAVESVQFEVIQPEGAAELYDECEYKLKIRAVNCGRSPALNLKCWVQVGTYSDRQDLNDQLERNADFVFNADCSKSILGQGLVRENVSFFPKQYVMDVAGDAGKCAFVYFACSYQDIYDNEYLYQLTNGVDLKWTENVMTGRNELKESNITVYFTSDFNGEVVTKRGEDLSVE
ncbi:MAG: hypothetical protein R3332_00375 [Pseudohongiellaceae bacterium]|nr:hypothetical protein [Pseudohongiellaceae bacterium]